jgi:hypothetical protein
LAVSEAEETPDNSIGFRQTAEETPEAGQQEPEDRRIANEVKASGSQATEFHAVALVLE